MTNNISLKQNIRFVDPRSFYKLVSDIKNQIGFSLQDPLYVANKSFYTMNIRTCSAGGLRNADGDAVGFHLLDCFKNYEHANDNCNEIYNAVKNPMSGIIVGSKNCYGAGYSRPIFSKMEKFFAQKIKGLSIFREHSSLDGYSSFAYDSKTNTWFILSQWWDSSEFVKSVKDLKNFYKRIIIAEGDKVFICGKEIDPQKIMTSNIQKDLVN